MTTQDNSDRSTSERAKQAASSATGEARDVASTAKEHGAQVASEAADATKNVARDVLNNVTDAAREHGGTQRDNIVSTLTSLGNDLSSMADQAPDGLAGDLTRQLADQARAVTARLEDRDPGEILDDVRRFARERPGMFLLGALGAGVVAGRLLAGARDGAAAAAAVRPAANTSHLESNPAANRAPSTPTAAADSTPTYVPDPATSVSTPGQPTHASDGHDGASLDDGATAKPIS